MLQILNQRLIYILGTEENQFKIPILEYGDHQTSRSSRDSPGFLTPVLSARKGLSKSKNVPVFENCRGCHHRNRLLLKVVYFHYQTFEYLLFNIIFVIRIRQMMINA